MSLPRPLDAPGLLPSDAQLRSVAGPASRAPHGSPRRSPSFPADGRASGESVDREFFTQLAAAISAALAIASLLLLGALVLLQGLP
jgi:hypothetical protein